MLIKFITYNGSLEDISASVQYVNITEQSYSQQSYHFNTISIEMSPTSTAREMIKPLGYEMGQIIRIESTTNTKLSIRTGMECDNRKQRVNIQFGIQINTACRLRYTFSQYLLSLINLNAFIFFFNFRLELILCIISLRFKIFN